MKPLNVNNTERLKETLENARNEVENLKNEHSMNREDLMIEDETR